MRSKPALWSYANFGGLSIEETAEVIGVSPATVKNKWNLARSWLHRELTGS
jgi:DNA-directed RNA polymerase specialized sigma24 family protein